MQFTKWDSILAPVVEPEPRQTQDRPRPAPSGLMSSGEDGQQAVKTINNCVVCWEVSAMKRTNKQGEGIVRQRWRRLKLQGAH